MELSSNFSDDLSAARGGDKAALDRLFDRFYPVVQQSVHRTLSTDHRSGRPWLAAVLSTGDVVQEVCMGVLRDLGGFSGSTEGEFAAFLISMSRNRVVDAVRYYEAHKRDRRRVDESQGEATLLEDQRGPIEMAVSAEEVALYCRVFASFPAREQALLRGRAEFHTTYERLAVELGYPTGDAARKAYFNAQARLLARLKSWGSGR